MDEGDEASDTTTATLIDGDWQPGGADELLVARNPVTEEPLDAVRASTTTQVDQAVRAAAAALRGPWSRTSPEERAALLTRLADLVEAEADTLADGLVEELGTPVRLSRAMHVDAVVRDLRWFAGQALEGPPGGYEERLAPRGGAESLLCRVPVGVVAVMPAYNVPLVLLVWKLGAVLASGCTAVVLPPPTARRSITAFVRLVEAAGLPPGVVNLVTGGPEVGAALTGHPGVALVSFTGSDAVGSAIVAQAAPHITRTVLELGGKAASIVLPGADLAAAAGASVAKFTRNTGQVCGAWSRLLVSHADAEEFTAHLAAALDKLVVGHPRDPSTTVGPVVSAALRDRLVHRIARARERGATVLAEAPEIPDRGYYVRPVVLGGLPPDDPVAQEELFGPIAVLLPYTDEDEALRIAHDTAYGLSGNVFGPPDRALALARRLRVGTATVNGGGPKRPDAPWTGWGRSGMGSELGREGFAEFFTVQHIQWQTPEEGS